MEARAPILTRSRYHALMTISPIRQVVVDRAFEETYGAPPGPGSPQDHVPAATIERDRGLLQRQTAKVLGYAQRFVAHRTPADTFPLTLPEVDEAIQDGAHPAGLGGGAVRMAA